MKLELNNSKRLLIGILAVAAVAIGFWALALSPKREEASKLDAEVGQVKGSLAQHRAEIATAEEARKDFPTEYQRLVVLGKAVPGDDEFPSLLVQMNKIAGTAGGTFRNIQLTAAGGESEAAAAPPAASSEGTPASPTEVAASLLPLGATVGPAGLAVMPYDVTFDGNFFQIADFIKGLDSLVKTKNSEVRVDGRLVTIDGFSLAASPDKGFPALQASFALTTYLTPPGEGSSGSASPESPGSEEAATPASTTIGAAP
jgi:Tfp pilus assembly protein PilO